MVISQQLCDQIFLCEGMAYETMGNRYDLHTNFLDKPVTWLHSVHEIPASISCSPQLVIPNGQILSQNLQAVIVVKIQISIHQKKALSVLCWAITIGSCELRWCKVTCGYKIFLDWTKWKTAGTRTNCFWPKHSFSQRAPNGMLFDVHWSLVRSTSHSWEWAVSFKNVNLPESLPQARINQNASSAVGDWLGITARPTFCQSCGSLIVHTCIVYMTVHVEQKDVLNHVNLSDL